jgi:hypothetical protein
MHSKVTSYTKFYGKKKEYSVLDDELEVINSSKKMNIQEVKDRL